MNFRGVGLRRTKLGTGLLVVLLTVGLLSSATTPVWGNSGDDPRLDASVAVLSAIVVSAMAYGIWENLPWRQDQPRLLKGEFYSGLYLGAAITPSQELNYNNGGLIIPTTTNPIGLGPFSTSKQKFDTGVMGGIKLGYFCNNYPNFGLEVETSFHPSRVKAQSVSLSPSIRGFTGGAFKSDNWVNWQMALHIVGRYGFIKDDEVPFGRLQPYLGIGPGMVAMYDQTDSAKNFTVDVMAGVRYMMTKNVAAFLEYKYDHQFSPEMEAHDFYLPNANKVLGTATLSVDTHAIVAGVSYHFH